MPDDVPELTWKPWSEPVRVKIERTGVHLFVKAVRDRNPVYRSDTAAQAAGFSAIPCPPTYTFVMEHGGAWPDIQPGATASTPSDGTAATGARAADSDENPTAALADAKGLFLHGEQQFVYHRTPVVGDLLEGRRRTSEPYVKQSRRGEMHVTHYETLWSDLDGSPVVTETIVGLFIPETPERPGDPA
jgi:N-terminal half of MaoC dehydratase